MAVLKDVLKKYTNVVTMRQLGCVPYREDPDFDCAPLVQAFLDTWGGTGSGECSALVTDGEVYHFEDYLTTPWGAGGAIIGVGSHGAESGTTQYANARGLSKWVYAGPYNAGRAFLTVQSESCYISGMSFQGYADDIYIHIWDHVADYCDIGIHIPSSDVSTTGKLHGNSIGFSAFGIAGIWQGDIDGVGNQADDLTYPGHMWFSSCGTAIYSNSIQVVNNSLGTVHCQGCGTGINAYAGGNWSVKHLYYGELSNNITPVSAVEIGSTDNYSFNADTFIFGLISMDGSVATAKVLNLKGPNQGYIEAAVKTTPAYAVAPAYIIEGPKILELRGSHHKANTIRLVENGGGTPTVCLSGKMASAQDHLDMVVSGVDTGYMYLEKVVAYNGDGGPCLPIKQTWEDGALASTETADSTIT
jgi:hypothetical protein